jgi:DNA-binding transcriptional MerR regulator
MYNDLVSFPAEGLRIGEFARRVGVSAAVLRAWERRYGLLEPVRSPGGFRLYTVQDAERVGRMQQGLDQGLSAAEAARAARASPRPSEGLLEDAAERLLAASRAYDEAAVHEVLDESFAAFGLEAVLRELVLPALTQVGREWEQGTLAVSQEHFASNVIRARLLSLARLWGRGSGPVAVLACAPGEQHDISLLAFGLVLRSGELRPVAPRGRIHPHPPPRQKTAARVERPRGNGAALQEAPRAAARRRPDRRRP